MIFLRITLIPAAPDLYWSVNEILAHHFSIRPFLNGDLAHFERSPLGMMGDFFPWKFRRRIPLWKSRGGDSGTSTMVSSAGVARAEPPSQKPPVQKMGRTV
jgi:hypothetical protein